MSRIITVPDDEETVCSDYEELHLLEYNARLCLLPFFVSISCLAYSSTLKLETTYSSKILADFKMDCTALYPRRKRCLVFEM
jgi:hypothetical protein